MDYPLPLQYETIQVYFEMPGEVFMWWNTTIDHISTTADKNVRAAASITFAEGADTNGNLYKAEKGSVQFLGGNRLKASSNMNSFPSGSVTTWKPLATGATGEVKTQFLTNHKTERTSDSDESVEYVQPQSLRRKRRRLNSHVISQDSTRPRLQSELSELRVLCGSLQQQVHALQERLTAVEYNEKRNATSSNVTQLKLFLKYDVMRCVRRTHSRITGENAAAFHSILRRCPIQFTLRCTLSTFTDFAKDLQQRVLHGVQYLPSSLALARATSPFKVRHIVFNDFYIFLSSLGILDIAAAKNLMVRKNFRKNLQLLQLIGGAQWDDENDERPLNIFIGHSCIRTDISHYLSPAKKEPQELQGREMEEIEKVEEVTKTDAEQGQLTTAAADSDETKTTISIANTKWSEDNGAFYCQFKQSSSNTFCNNVTYESVLDHDAFTLTWRPLQGLRPQQSFMMGEQEVLGNISVYIPSVVVSGADLCNTISTVLRNGSSDFYPPM